ncbi:MAG TPA: hypothetical protein VGI79_17570 [Caulobacteraceae bacterium]
MRDGLAAPDGTAGSGALGTQLIQVAFAGHNRPDDLGDTLSLERDLTVAFGLLAAADVKGARLLTGNAPGADRLAARLWGECGLGPIHIVQPFLTDEDDPDRQPPTPHITRLDGAAFEASGRNPHLAQTRWMIGSADMLVTVWTGEHARGAGGTADAVRLALEHNLPVLWVKPGDAEAIRLIRPQYLPDDFGFLEFLEQLEHRTPPLVVPAAVANLSAALEGLDLSPDAVSDLSPDEEPPGPLRWFDDWLQLWLWRTYNLFRRVVGGRPAPSRPTADPPADLNAQPGFQLLSQTYLEADQEANRLAAVHRSQQILLLGAALLAAIVGSSPAVWPQFKIYAVLIELGLALAALAVWMGAGRANRHHRWGGARRLAEQLRLERAAWTLGISTVGTRRERASAAAAAVRLVRCRAGLAGGAFDADRVQRWGAWAMDELLAGQAHYHQIQGRLNGRIAHRIHWFENFTFTVFIVILLSFAVAFEAAGLTNNHLPHWIGGAVLMAGAIVPAMGAASLALEATLGFGEHSQRSLSVAQELELLMATLGPAPSLDTYQTTARAAVRLESLKEDRWSEDTDRRRLFRGG